MLQSVKTEAFVGDFVCQGSQINIGQVRFGQSLDFVIEVNPQKNHNFSLSNLNDMSISYESCGQRVQAEFEHGAVPCKLKDVLPDLYRFKTINVLKQVNLMWKNNIDGASHFLSNFITEYENLNLPDDNISQGIILNLKQQQLKALEKQKYMLKWGKHQQR